MRCVLSVRCMVVVRRRSIVLSGEESMIVIVQLDRSGLMAGGEVCGRLCFDGARATEHYILPVVEFLRK